MDPKNEDDHALRTTSKDVFKADYSSDNLYKIENYYSSGHKVQHCDHKSHNQSNNLQIDRIKDDYTIENKNSQMLEDDKKNETVVKMDEYNEQETLLDQNDPPIKAVSHEKDNNRKHQEKEEINEDKKCKDTSSKVCKDSNLLNHLGQSHSVSKFSHEHNHYFNHNRAMDLVFRNIYISIPIKSSKKMVVIQDKELINRMNWFKKLCSKIYFADQKSLKFKSSKLVEHHRDILSNISGFSKPGELLAIMGPTASGKTTLLNTLSGRLKARKGSITINGEELNKQMKRKIGYVMQNDVFFAGLTLKQTLVYTALLRMPESMSKAKKLKHVQRVIELLDLTSCQDTIIGDFIVRGLSGGERKRASIACELLTNPSIMLLDEPTSGLDSFTAFDLMQKIKEYAVKEGKTIIATVHQPSSQLFYIFDKLLLLAKGQLAYFGKSTHVVPFFEGLGYTISAHYNPADLMMEKIKQKDEIGKIIKAAKNLIKNYSILSHNHHRGSNASNCKHLLKLTNKIESQNDCSLIGIDELDQDTNNHLSSNIQTENETTANQFTNRNQLINQHSSVTHHHCHHHFQKHHLNTLKEATECTNYNKNMSGNNNTDICPDICCKRGCKSLIRSIHDDDSGRSSWTETDRSSTATFSSSNNSCSSSTCSTEDVYSEVNFEIEQNSQQTNSLEHHSDHHTKWPTSFVTQVNVLTRRNFQERRHRMLSKLNWIQTIGLGILSGLMWFQMNRLESKLNDLKGFLFFSTSYWMLFAWFQVLISIPAEREVMNKERSSGAYRLSAFYIAKMIGELPLVITLPSLYFFICYPMFAINLNLYNFLSQWLFMVLCALVAQSIGLFIGLTTLNLEVSVTVSAIYSTAVSLFGGYYSSTLPNWLNWMRYTSILNYAFENMQLIEYKYGGQIRCANVNSKFDYCLKQIVKLKERIINESELSINNRSLIIESTNEEKNKIDSLLIKQLDDQDLFIPYDELISELNSPSFWTNIGILISFLFFFRLLGYLVLRFK